MLQPIEFLITEFVSRGLEVDERLARKILERKEEAAPYLIGMVRGNNYWESDDEDEYWAAVAALHLLPLIGGKDALDAVVAALYNHAKEMEECLTEDSPSILAHFGVGALDTLRAMVLDKSLYIFSRDAAARAMWILARDGHAPKDEVTRTLREAVAQAEDEFDRTTLAMTVADSKDPESLPFLLSLVEEGKVDGTELSRKELEDIFGGKHDTTISITFDSFDMWEYFRHRRWYHPLYEDEGRGRIQQRRRVPADFAFWCEDCEVVVLRAASFSSGVSGRIVMHSEGRAGFSLTSLGRNEPCPCRSGKKFKKCCLPVLQDCETANRNIEQGFERLPKDVRGACDSWMIAFEAIRRVADKGIESTTEFDEAFPIPDIRDWADDFAAELWNASDKGDRRRYHAKRIGFCDWFTAQFTDEDEETLGDFYVRAAQSTWMLGDVKGGERRFEELVSRFPRYFSAYMEWSSMYWDAAPGAEKDYGRAESILLECLEHTWLSSEERKAAEERLNKLRKERGAQGAGIEPATRSG